MARVFILCSPTGNQTSDTGWMCPRDRAVLDARLREAGAAEKLFLVLVGVGTESPGYQTLITVVRDGADQHRIPV
jgi:hypothetical protein